MRRMLQTVVRYAVLKVVDGATAGLLQNFDEGTPRLSIRWPTYRDLVYLLSKMPHRSLNICLRLSMLPVLSSRDAASCDAPELASNVYVSIAVLFVTKMSWLPFTFSWLMDVKMPDGGDGRAPAALVWV